MALSAKINGVVYKCVDDYSIKEQGGAVSGTTLNVLLGANPIPLVLHQVQLYIDGALFFTGLARSIGTPEYSSSHESNVFSLDVSSLETLLTMRLITKNFYYYTFASWTAVVQWIFDNYIAEEGITLGAISTTAKTFDSKYSVTNKKVSDVLNDIANAIGNASWKISADRKFYFQVATDFTSVTVPAKLSRFKLSDDIGDLRTVQTIVGASSGIKATSTNAALVATIAARTGGSGKIEVVENDSSIRSDTKAATEAADRLANYAETTKEITCLCHDLAASTIFRSWPLSHTINGVYISGDYIVVERTITHQVGSKLNITVKLKNNNFFSRYGYKLKDAAQIAKSATAEISDTYSDDSLTPVEKKAALPRWETALGEKDGVIAQAAAYGLTSLKTTYEAAFQSLANYLNGGTTWSTGVPLWFTDDAMTQTEDIDGDAWRLVWLTYDNALTAIITGIRGVAGAVLSLSTNTATRNRAGTIVPATLILAARTGDGGAYAGRFTIEISHNGTAWQAAYTSAGDESSKTYTIPATMIVSSVMYFVVGIRVRLYAAGGTVSLIAESICSVALESSSSAIYWGALTTAPAASIIAGDYYWDNRTVALGGGVLKLYSGSAWATYAVGSSGWSNAIATAMDDILVWGAANPGATGDYVVAANAVFGAITTKVLVTNAITGPMIQGGAVDANKLAAGSREAPNDPVAYWSMDSVPEIPDDPSGVTYLQDAWATVDGWTATGGAGVTQPTVADGKLIIPSTSIGAQRNMSTAPAIPDPQGKTWRLEFTVTTLGSSTIQFYYRTTGGSVLFDTKTIALGKNILNVVVPSGVTVTYLAFLVHTNTVGSVDWVYIGAGAYLPASLIDNSGNGNHGQIIGATPVPGISGKALSFNGLTNRVEVPNFVMPDIFDFSCFLNCTTLAAAGAIASIGAISTAHWELYRLNTSDTLILSYWNGSARVTPPFSGFFTGFNGVFVQIDLSINWSTGAYILRRNGTQFSAGTLTTPSKPATGTFIIGNYIGGVAGILGSIDEVRGYDRTLSEAESKYLVENKATSFGTVVENTIVKADASNYWDLVTGEFLATIGTDKTFHLNPATGDAELTNVPIRSYQGSGVQRRATQLDNDSLDWLDCPVTSPASPEQLRARIGRLGVGGAILMDGDFNSPIISTFSTAVQKSTDTIYDPTIIRRANGKSYVVFADVTLSGLYWALYDESTDSLGSFALITANGGRPSLIEDDNGILRCLYIRWETDAYLCERIYDDSTSTWGSEIVVSASSAYGDAKYTLYNSQLYIVYGIYGATAAYYWRTWDGTTLGSPIAIVSGLALTTGATPSCKMHVNSINELWLYYDDTSNGDIYRKKYLGGATWDTTSVVASEGTTSAYCRNSTVKTLLDGTDILAYSQATIGIRYRIIDGDTIGDATTAYATYYSDATVEQLAGGNLLLAFTSSNKLYLSTLQRYARIGAGIIESGGDDTNGRYIKYGDGTMVQWGGCGNTATYSANDAIKGSFAAGFINSDYRVVILPTSGADYYLNASAASTLGISISKYTTYFTYDFASGTVKTRDVIADYIAYGRWKA